MKKLVLLGGLAMSLGVTTAQTFINYETFNDKRARLNYYTNNQDASGAFLYPTNAINPLVDNINKTDSVGRFDRQAGTPTPNLYTIITCGTNPKTSTGAWGTFNMAKYPVMSMDVYSTDSLKVRMLVKDKTNTQDNLNKDLEWKDFIYGVDPTSKVDDRGKWKRLVADFSNRAAVDWPANVELQLYFSYGWAKTVTVWFDNVNGATSVANVPTAVAKNNVAPFEMLQNSPNPANDITNISYSLESSETVSLKVYDVLGKCVATLVNDKQAAGKYSVVFDVTSLENGIYYSTLSVNGVAQTQKLQVVR